MQKNIFLIDDHELFREGLKLIINSWANFNVVKSISVSSFIREFLNEPSFKNCDLAIICPPSSEHEAIELMQNYLSNVSNSMMIFTNECTKNLVLKTIEIGGCAYFTKDISLKELEGVLQEITTNENFSDLKLHPTAREVLMLDEIPYLPLTIAEADVFQLVCQQKSSVEISEELGISVRTVESRKRNMMKKSQSKNIIGVVMHYLKTLELK